MWRYGFPTPPDYNDNQGFCGGFQVQWEQNGGQCGLCGDNWADPVPRRHEAGGRFATGTIAGQYQTGQDIPISVEVTLESLVAVLFSYCAQVTANHAGHFSFRLCKAAGAMEDPVPGCLELHSSLLSLAGTGETQYWLQDRSASNMFTFVYLINIFPDAEARGSTT